MTTTSPPKYLTLASAKSERSRTEELCLLLDVSPSMENKDYPPSRLAAAMHAACALIDEKIANGSNDRIAVVNFASDAVVVHPIADIEPNVQALKQAICRMSTRSCTNITAGLAQAGELLGETISVQQTLPGAWDQLKGFLSKAVYDDPPASANAVHQPQRRIILLSDGGHNTGPKKEMFAVADRLKSSGVIIAAIGIGGSPAAIDEADLKRIASIDPPPKAPLYCFIADSAGLIREFKRQANYLRKLKEAP